MKASPLSLYLLLLLPAVAWQTPPIWESKAPMPKGLAFPLQQPVAIDGRLYVASGSWAGVNGTVYEYDPKADVWVDRKAPMPTRRHHYAVVAAGGRLFAIGGCTGETEDDRHEPTAAVEEYDPGSKAWRARASLPDPRRNASAAALNGRIYVFGGENPGNNNVPLAIYDVAADKWTRMTITAGIGMWAAAQAVNGRIYLIGDARPESGRRGPHTLEFDPATNAFEVKAPFTVPRGAFGSAAANGWIYLLGGMRGPGKWMAASERYRPSTDTWEKVPDLPKPAGYPGVAELERRIYLLGGVTDKFDNAEKAVYLLR